MSVAILLHEKATLISLGSRRGCGFGSTWLYADLMCSYTTVIRTLWVGVAVGVVWHYSYSVQVERGIINLAGAKVQYSKDKQKTSGVRWHSGCGHVVDHVTVTCTFLFQNTFSICTKYRGILLQTKEKEVQEWIYAMDPLLAGSIKYVTHHM